MIYKIKRFFEKIFRIIDYLPILWNDEDYDFEYILPILRKKVDRIGKKIYKNKIIAPYENVYQETRDFIRAIDNYQNHFELYEEIFGLAEDYKSENEKEYYINLYKFEVQRWNEIWNIIKKRGRGWWD